MQSQTLGAVAATLCLVAVAAHAADPTLPAFDPANFANPAPNPYFPLEVGHRNVLQGTGMDGDKTVNEVGSMIVTGPGLVLMGIQTVQVLDQAEKNGRLIERTFDYYATDKDGNLWYFGEDVTNYRYDDAGIFTGTDSKSAWRAGVNGAVPGISISGNPVVGLAQFQEQALADGAMDYFEVMAVDATVKGPGGTYTDVLKTFDGSTSDPDLREFKFYAKGIGFVRTEEGLSEARDNPELVMEFQP